MSDPVRSDPPSYEMVDVQVVSKAVTNDAPSSSDQPLIPNSRYFAGFDELMVDPPVSHPGEPLDVTARRAAEVNEIDVKIKESIQRMQYECGAIIQLATRRRELAPPRPSTTQRQACIVCVLVVVLVVIIGPVALQLANVI